MATDAIPPFLAHSPAEPLESVELAPMYLTRWLVFLVKHGQERWWQWCPVSLAGGIDIAHVRWSKPRGPLLPPAEAPDPTSAEEGRPSQQKVWEFGEVPFASFDLPYLAPEL